ncbi:MAG: arginine--tRNA ligase [Patescibacteria group bacterium]|nr:arginine--tRNA ligase [Patescibacteria group bacterium]
MLKKEISLQLKRVCHELWPELKTEVGQDFFFQTVEYTKDASFGDISSSIALQLSRRLSRNPLDLAEKIIGSLSRNFQNKFTRIEAVMPGFINFTLGKLWLSQQVTRIIEADRNYGKGDSGQNEKVQVEFISANPTGPIHLGNGRGAFLGDTLARIFSSQGYEARREYYINDIGNQLEILAESVIRRYLQKHGLKVDFPERCYQGEYIKDLAKKLTLGNVKLKDLNRLKKRIKEKILKIMIDDIQRMVQEKLKIRFNKWYYESELYRQGAVKNILEQLKAKDLIYKQEGATWIKTSAFGDDKDRVAIKANRENTYFLSDVAYHWNKFVERGFNRVVDIWGADHQGHVIRMQAVKKALGWPGRLDIIIVQLVRLISQNKEVKMSKRSGTFVTLEELVDDVGLDVARFFFLMRSSDTHMDFDLDLAKEKSEKNPVYYVQYAHARICSILKQSELRKISKQPSRIEEFDHQAEIDLLKELLRLPDLLKDVCETYEVQRLPFYTIKVAELFHNFYTQCRVINQGEVNQNRVVLIKATRVVLRNCLKLMGVSVPNSM